MYEDEDLIVLTTTDGEEIEFVTIAGISYKGEFYSILQPTELIEGMEEDEALVFHLEMDGDESKYTIVLDEEIIDHVFAEYNRLLDSQE